MLGPNLGQIFWARRPNLGSGAVDVGVGVFDRDYGRCAAVVVVAPTLTLTLTPTPTPTPTPKRAPRRQKKWFRATRRTYPEISQPFLGNS